MKTKACSLFFILILLHVNATACIWDAKTIWTEKLQHPTLAQVILHPKSEQPDIKSLTEEIQKLKATPKTNDPTWWNDLAGSYLRLGKPEEAVKILEPITNQFADDYGVHANLGTAYHLMGRYTDAEREIRRDTEINTNAHFGLEKYHLALLQYLSRDENYRARHVYVDEFTEIFLLSGGRWGHVKTKVGEGGDSPPAYTKNWDLGHDSKLEEGVIYMATLNPKEPACWVMMGTLAMRHSDYHLAKAAFEKAIQLGSPQEPILRKHLERAQNQIDHWITNPINLLMGGIALVVAIYIFCKWREFRRNRAILG